MKKFSLLIAAIAMGVLGCDREASRSSDQGDQDPVVDPAPEKPKVESLEARLAEFAKEDAESFQKLSTAKKFVKILPRLEAEKNRAVRLKAFHDVVTLLSEAKDIPDSICDEFWMSLAKESAYEDEQLAIIAGLEKITEPWVVPILDLYINSPQDFYSPLGEDESIQWRHRKQKTGFYIDQPRDLHSPSVNEHESIQQILREQRGEFDGNR